MSQQNSFNQVQAAFHRIQRSAAVLSTRVRGRVSSGVVRQIQDDAGMGLAALRELVAGITGAIPAHIEVDSGAPLATSDPNVSQPDVATLIGLLLNILDMVSRTTSLAENPELHATIDAAQSVARTMGFTPQEQAATPMMSEPTADEDDYINLADVAETLSDPNRPPGQVADEDLLAAVKAAVVAGIEEVHRRADHCRFLFGQIQSLGGAGSLSEAFSFADIGFDVTTEIQGECISLRQMLTRASGEVDHG